MRRALFLILVLSGCLLERPAELPDLAQPLALLSGPTLSGQPVDVAALAGKVVVINFWSPG